MDLFTYLLGKNGKNTHRDLFSYLLGKNAGGSGTYTTFSGITLNIASTLRAKIKNFMLNSTELTQDGTPTPDTPLAIHTITGDNEVVVCGKNLFNINNYIIKGEVVAFDISNLIEGQQYIFTTNLPVYWFKISTNGSGYNSVATHNANGITTLVFTMSRNSHIPPTETQYLFLSVNASSPFQLPTDFSSYQGYNIQIEKGNSSSQYEPYKSNSVLLTLGELKLCKIGNYEDKIFKAIKGNEIYDSLASEKKATLDYGKWYLRKAINKIVLNGSENWSYSGKSGIFYTENITDYAISDNIPYSNYYKGENNVAGAGYIPINNTICFINKSGLTTPRLYIYDTTYTSVASELTTWLSTHNTDLYYALATPVNELFNDTIQAQLDNLYNNAKSYDGQTNITQTNDDLPFNISVDVKVTSANLSMSNSLNTSLLSSNIQEEPNIDDIQEEPNLDEIEEQNDEPIEEEVS